MKGNLMAIILIPKLTGKCVKICQNIEKFDFLLLTLLKDQYSATSEERINDRLEKLEKHTHRLSDIAEYLVSLKYNKARDHREEVEDFQEILDKCSEEIFTVLHNHQVANPAVPQPAAAQAQAARPLSKASASELKPERLTHDSSASAFRSWKKCFRAYYDSCLLYTSPSPRDRQKSRMPSSA